MRKYLALLFTLVAFSAFGPAFGQSTLGGGTVGIPGLTTNAVRERHLKAVDSPADEECLTYELSVGDFEWQNCIAGSVTDVTGSAPITSSGGATPDIAIMAATGGAAGSMSAADKTKLDGVETAADVTDTANVTSALPVADSTSLVTFGTDKEVRIDVGAVTDSTVRVITMPDQDIDLAPGTGSYATEAEGTLAAAALPLSGGTMAGEIVGADNIISGVNLKDSGEITNAIGDTGGGAQDIDLTLGNVVTATQTVSATTYTFSNPTASDEGSSFTFILVNGASNGGTIWPAVTWVTGGGVTPTLQTSGTDILSFFTVDGGTNWYGYGPVTGTRSLWIPALEWTPAVTNGAVALAAAETTALRPDIKHLGFATAADDFAQASIAFPTSWDNGTITFQVYWAHAAASTFTVDWALQCVTITDDETMDVAYGTAVVVEDTGGTTEDLYVTVESGAVTCAGTPIDGELTEFQIYRDVSGDDLDADADMIGVKIFYTVDANT